MIKIYLRTKTVEVLLARKNEDLDWLAKFMSISSWHARELMKGRAPVTPEGRKRVLDAFRGMATRRGRPCWDDFFTIREEE